MLLPELLGRYRLDLLRAAILGDHALLCVCVCVSWASQLVFFPLARGSISSCAQRALTRPTSLVLSAGAGGLLTSRAGRNDPHMPAKSRYTRRVRAKLSVMAYLNQWASPTWKERRLVRLDSTIETSVRANEKEREFQLANFLVHLYSTHRQHIT